MKELIPISDNNGKKAVSARLLHEFLESKRDFTTWIKDRIKKYGFVENQDYCLLTDFVEQSGRGGHNKVDYILTIECAKEISMVEGNAKGKQARQYFIECEKISNDKKQIESKPLTVGEMFLQSAQVMVEHESRLSRIESQQEEISQRVAAIQEDKDQALYTLQYLPLSNCSVPPLNLRRSINALVNNYAEATQLNQGKVWKSVYKKLYFNYGVRLSGYKKLKGENTLLDVAERIGQLENIYTIISEFVKSTL